MDICLCLHKSSKTPMYKQQSRYDQKIGQNQRKEIRQITRPHSQHRPDPGAEIGSGKPEKLPETPIMKANDGQANRIPRQQKQIDVHDDADFHQDLTKAIEQCSEEFPATVYAAMHSKRRISALSAKISFQL
jgi:hypothetical protein